MLINPQFGIVGTTFRRGGQDALNRYRLPSKEPQFSTLRRALHEELGLVESVYLNTCNRIELFFVLPPGQSVVACRRAFHAFFRARCTQQESMVRPEKALHAYVGEGAIERLFVIASALDSMVPGEAQILGQLKGAMADAERDALAGSSLKQLFASAYAVAKRVRSETALGRGVVSMVSAALQKARAHLDTVPQGALRRVAIVGTGEMSKQAAQALGALANTQLVFISRELSRAHAMANAFGGEAVALSSFLAAPSPCSLLFTSTASSIPVFGQAFFAASAHGPGRRMMVIDLNVQRDCVANAALEAGAVYLDIDALEAEAQTNRLQRQAEMGSARLLVDEALLEMRKRHVDREMAPVARALREAFSDNVARSLTELQADWHEPMPEQAQEKMASFARTLVSRLAHVPTVGLKKIGYLHGVGAVDTFLTALDERREKKHE